jgi:hypothetical protein
MFEPGKKYRLRTMDGDVPSDFTVTVTDVSMPLIKTNSERGEEVIYNAASPTFVSAKRISN